MNLHWLQGFRYEIVDLAAFLRHSVLYLAAEEATFMKRENSVVFSSLASLILLAAVWTLWPKNLSSKER